MKCDNNIQKDLNGIVVRNWEMNLIAKKEKEKPEEIYPLPEKYSSGNDIKKEHPGSLEVDYIFLFYSYWGNLLIFFLILKFIYLMK